MKLSGIILAAGASRRMGSPKALLDWQGETFLDRWIAMLAEVCDPVIVALGHHEHAIRSGIRRGGHALFAVNPDPDRGMLSSLQCALSVPECRGAFLFTPVDQPLVRAATVAAIASAAGPAVVVPRYRGAGGHPVRCAARLAPEFLLLPPAARVRDAIQPYLEPESYLDVDDPGVAADVDYPEDYQRLLETARDR